MTITVGNVLPNHKLKLVVGDNVVDIETETLFKEKKIVLFAVPGAFAPVCSKAHVPGYIKESDAFKSRGVDAIVCLAVNDPFVLKAWGDALGAEDKVHFLSDFNADFTKALGMELDISVAGLGIRSKRFAMLVEDGVVKTLDVEETAAACSISSAESVLTILG